MKVKRTLHEIYSELTQLREQRDMMGRVATESYIEGETRSFQHFVKRYNHYDEVINYLSEIEVEYEDKYESGGE